MNSKTSKKKKNCKSIFFFKLNKYINYHVSGKTAHLRSVNRLLKNVFKNKQLLH